MKNGFIFTDGKELEFIGVGQLSIGAGLQLDSRFAYDYSKRPQSIMRRRRKTARTATLTLQISRNALNPGMNLFESVDAHELLVGQTGDIYWNGANVGTFCVRGASFSFAVDAIDIATAVQISLELTESYQKAETKRRTISKVEVF